MADRDTEYMGKIAEITADINLEYDVALSPVIFSEYEYLVNRNMGSPFTIAVESEGVRL
ncbi:MAG: hypothetical protein QME32_07775 [Endomicrobiia bacterium]|nr:hypothetical protein [Endomicrobiia bacterium]